MIFKSSEVRISDSIRLEQRIWTNACPLLKRYIMTASDCWSRILEFPLFWGYYFYNHSVLSELFDEYLQFEMNLGELTFFDICQQIDLPREEVSQAAFLKVHVSGQWGLTIEFSRRSEDPFTQRYWVIDLLERKKLEIGSDGAYSEFPSLRVAELLHISKNSVLRPMEHSLLLLLKLAYADRPALVKIRGQIQKSWSFIGFSELQSAALTEGIIGDPSCDYQWRKSEGGWINDFPLSYRNPIHHRFCREDSAFLNRSLDQLCSCQID